MLQALSGLDPISIFNRSTLGAKSDIGFLTLVSTYPDLPGPYELWAQKMVIYSGHACMAAHEEHWCDTRLAAEIRDMHSVLLSSIVLQGPRAFFTPLLLYTSLSDDPPPFS